MFSIHQILSNNWLQITLRLSFALILGAIIGLERELKHKPAGLRTHMLVSLASAIFTLIPWELTGGGSNLDTNNLSRIIQGIAAGVGFLGAGEILRASSQTSQRPEVHGLTSAAAIWVSASLGIAAGCGLWELGLIGGVFTFLVLYVFKRFEKSSLK
ncbi:MgtC/SapB family protein [Calothrix sp. PCC 6303]|uniref:MgtC/SapB family protein n=1 Tax=Calothrix sp. PCC 6303 TaxID=1170562 RepID=UPI0002A013EA|nr:MgtC/SapB family protein [Calothrix sp. PCC 6303]AFY99978.1 MgtC/SapB transporter [Calothrix sp. PCC 6303]